MGVAAVPFNLAYCDLLVSVLCFACQKHMRLENSFGKDDWSGRRENGEKKKKKTFPPPLLLLLSQNTMIISGLGRLVNKFPGR